ncbi:CotH kinase family protein [Marinobacteraceae bacterium S3BR75-40.1]
MTYKYNGKITASCLLALLLTGCGGDSQDSSTSASAEATTQETAPTDTVVSSSPELVINEIVAKDSEAGHDWVELYAAGSQDITLGDYRLKDEDSESALPLPDVTLSPGQYYRLYCDDELADDETGIAIKLGSSDSVSLYHGDDLIDYLEWDQGQALIGFSFGHLPDGYGAIQTLTPTPETGNQAAERGPLMINEVAVAEGWFELYNNGSTSLDLRDYAIENSTADAAANLPDATLAPGEHRVVETNGSEVALELLAEDELKLIHDDETVDYLAWDASDAPQGYSFGATSDGSWINNILEVTRDQPNQALVFFHSDAVKDLHIDIGTDDWRALLDAPTEEAYFSADVTYLGVTTENIGFRTKGNSSLSHVAQSDSERYSFKVDSNEYVDGQKVLGMKKFNLNNNFKDPSYLRETLAYEMLRDLGVPAPRTAYVNLYINGELYGLYTLVEQVDGEFVERNFTDPEGDLYKPDGTGSDLVWIDDNFASYDGVALKTNEDSSDNQAFIDLLYALNKQGAAAPVVDVERLLKYLAVSTALSNLDSYQGPLAHNYYLYEEAGYFTLIPWDWNESFGSFAGNCSDDERLQLYIDEPTAESLSERPLLDVVLADDDLKAQYHDYLTQLLAGPLEPTTFSTRVVELADLIRASVYADPTAFFTPTEFETALNSDVNGIFGLTDFVEERGAAIEDQLSGATPSAGDGSGSCSGDSMIPGGPGGDMPPPPQ